MRSPYDGTPAEHFAVGGDGIVLPPAEPVSNGYLADRLAGRDIAAGEVAEALDDIRAALIATRLDRRMLVAHDPDPFIRTLAGVYWDIWFDPYIPGFPGNKKYQSPEFGHLATRLAPAARLAAEPRVAGRVTYGPATTYIGAPATETVPYRILEIVTRFVWVYAFEVPQDAIGAAVVVVRNDVVWYVPTDYRLDCCQANLGFASCRGARPGLGRRLCGVRAWPDPARRAGTQRRAHRNRLRRRPAAGVGGRLLTSA